MNRMVWGYPLWGWGFFASWMALLCVCLGWKGFALHFGFRAALIGAVFGGAWVVERINLSRSRVLRRGK